MSKKETSIQSDIIVERGQRMKHKWSVGNVKCKSCGKRWVAVRRSDTDDDRLECPRCHKQNSEIVWSDKE